MTVNVYFTTTQEYLLLSVTKQSTPTSTPVLVTGVQTSIVPSGTPKGTFVSSTAATGYSGAADISALPAGTYDCYYSVADPDNPGRTVKRIAGTFRIV